MRTWVTAHKIFACGVVLSLAYIFVVILIVGNYIPH